MSTITVTESKETTKTETRSVTSEYKTGQNSEIINEIVGSKMKKNKNSNLRKSKLALSFEHVEPKEDLQANEKDTSEAKESKTDVDEDTDSAIGLTDYSCMSLESLLNEAEDLQHDLEETKWKIIEAAKGSDYPSPQSSTSSSNTQPTNSFMTKPEPTAAQVHDVEPKFNVTQPVPKKEECIVQSQQEDQGTFEQTEIDGEVSQTLHLKLHPEIDGESSLVCSMETSSLSSCSRAGMSDFVILHTDADHEDACSFKEHLHRDIQINDLAVDLLSNINAGKPGIQSLATLHENYRYILPYVTENLERDNYSRFKEEIVLTIGLKEGNGKEDRVVPVLTRKDCNIFELSIIEGLQYFNFCSSNTHVKNSYIECVKRLVQEGRNKFP